MASALLQSLESRVALQQMRRAAPAFASRCGGDVPVRHLSARAVPLVRGMRDIVGPDCALRETITQVLRGAARTHCYQEIATPLIEQEAVFLRTLGQDSDVVAKEMYIVSASPREAEEPAAEGTAAAAQRLALRPEGTAGIMRALISSGALRQTLPQRLFYSGPMFRHERPQQGRYRQFHQVGVELVGSTHAEDDAEVIAMADAFLGAVLDRDALHVTLLLNTLGDPDTLRAYLPELRAYLGTRQSSLSPDSRARLQRGAVLRVLDSKDPRDAEVIAEAPVITAFLSPAAETRFAAVCGGLDALGVSYRLSPTLVRGLDYYSHTIFEFVASNAKGAVAAAAASQSPGSVTPPLPIGTNAHAKPVGGGTGAPALKFRPDGGAAAHSDEEGAAGDTAVPLPSASASSQSAVGHLGTLLAGGRYDGLCEALGGPAGVGAIGWAAGLDRLALLTKLPRPATGAPDVVILPLLPGSQLPQQPASGEAAFSASRAYISQLALLIAQALRGAGKSAVILHGGRSVKKLMAAASKSSAHAAVLIGEEEVRAGALTVKLLGTGAQRSVPLFQGSGSSAAAGAAAAGLSAAASGAGPGLSAPWDVRRALQEAALL